jgi:hypothetical protein
VSRPRLWYGALAAHDAAGSSPRDDFDGEVWPVGHNGSDSWLPPRSRLSLPRRGADLGEGGESCLIWTADTVGAESGGDFFAIGHGHPLGFYAQLLSTRRRAERNLSSLGELRAVGPSGDHRALSQPINLKGTSKNSPRQSLTTKLPSNDSALFPFRFVDVRSRRVRVWHCPKFSRRGNGPCRWNDSD